MDVHEVMGGLAKHRLFFHSERDFQHALAWWIQQELPAAAIRLEPRPRPGVHLDVLVRLGRRAVAIEVKYLVAAFAGTVDGERFEVPNRAAHDISRYDVVKDVVRLERLVADGYADYGIAVTLTNDPAYWRPGLKADPIDVAFRIHEGQRLAGQLGWSPAAGIGTTRSREQPLILASAYTCCWRLYGTVIGDGGRRSELRYLALEVRGAAIPTAVSTTAVPSPVALPGGRAQPVDAATARLEILLAVNDLLRRTGGTEFEIGAVVAEMRRRGSRFAESTIRTHITSRMCANAPNHHASVFDDFERLDRGRYRLRRPPNS